MTFSADGGPGLLILVLVIVGLGVLAFRNIPWITRRRTAGNGSNSSSPSHPPPPAPSPAPSGGGHHGGGHHGSSVKDKIVIAVIWVASILVVMYLLVAAVHWLFGAGTLPDQPSPRGRVVVTSSQTSSAPVQSTSKEAKDLIQAERDRISSEDHVLRFRYGEVQEWIHVPDGGFVTDLTVDDKKVVGEQCSSSEEKPPVDAKGPDYECHTGTIAHWVRFSAWSEDEGLITVHYHFRYAF